ncbi:hypothetical protein F4779DRAFT_639873 [Xylariaceae sp. FL0662B]|nr:hypothetical protein F4779DRAFT_639873 [Xylariaceae sp. FL0662B]
MEALPNNDEGTHSPSRDRIDSPGSDANGSHEPPQSTVAPSVSQTSSPSPSSTSSSEASPEPHTMAFNAHSSASLDFSASSHQRGTAAQMPNRHPGTTTAPTGIGRAVSFAEMTAVRLPDGTTAHAPTHGAAPAHTSMPSLPPQPINTGSPQPLPAPAEPPSSPPRNPPVATAAAPAPGEPNPSGFETAASSPAPPVTPAVTPPVTPPVAPPAEAPPAEAPPSGPLDEPPSSLPNATPSGPPPANPPFAPPNGPYAHPPPAPPIMIMSGPQNVTILNSGPRPFLWVNAPVVTSSMPPPQPNSGSWCYPMQSPFWAGTSHLLTSPPAPQPQVYIAEPAYVAENTYVVYGGSQPQPQTQTYYVSGGSGPIIYYQQ